MPIFQSADHLHGYHVTDYERIDWDLGDDADLADLNRAAHALGMRVIVDYVINHSSRYHRWFLEAWPDKAASKRYRDYYIWFPDGEYGYGRDIYYKKLSAKQGWADIPDVNLSNPFMLGYFLDVAKGWMDPNGDGNFDDGIDGLRLDHVTGPDHSVWRLMRKQLKAFRPDVALVAEAFTDTANIADYYHGEFDCSFTFPFYYAAMAVVRDHKNAKDTLGGLFGSLDQAFPTGSWHCPFSSNHDVPWHKTLYQDLGQKVGPMRSLAGLLLATPGTPGLLYGDEVGMVNHRGAFPWTQTGKDNELLQMWRALLQARAKSKALRAGTLSIGSSNKPWDIFVMRRQAGQEQVVAAVNLMGGNFERVRVGFAGAQLAQTGQAYRAVDLLSGVSRPVDEAKSAVVYDFGPNTVRWLRLEAVTSPETPVTVRIECNIQGSVGKLVGGAVPHVSGDHSALAQWNPNKVALRNDGQGGDGQANDTIWTVQFSVSPGTLLAYKFTIDKTGVNGWSGQEWGGDKANRQGYVGDLDSDGVVVFRSLFGAAGVEVIEP